jgi:hypothetical protein
VENEKRRGKGKKEKGRVFFGFFSVGFWGGCSG